MQVFHRLSEYEYDTLEMVTEPTILFNSDNCAMNRVGLVIQLFTHQLMEGMSVAAAAAIERTRKMPATTRYGAHMRMRVDRHAQ